LSKDKNPIVARSLVATWHGPVPLPSTLAEYERLVPGSADRIIAMAEAEARFRHDTIARDHESEGRIKENDVRDCHAGIRRGQWLAAMLVLAIVAASTACAVLGHDWVAASISGIGITGLAGTFIGRKTR